MRYYPENTVFYPDITTDPKLGGYFLEFIRFLRPEEREIG